MMSKYSEYINLQDYILDHIDHLNLRSIEAFVLLQLEFNIRKKRHIDPKLLSAQCQLSTKELDEIMTLLIQKGLLKVNVSNTGVEYQLQNIIDEESKVDKSNQSDLISIFEREFKRPLSTHEIDKLNDWLMKLDYRFIIHALREAVIYQKISFNYIDRILITWVNDKKTLADLDAGNK